MSQSKSQKTSKETWLQLLSRDCWETIRYFILEHTGYVAFFFDIWAAAGFCISLRHLHNGNEAKGWVTCICAFVFLFIAERLMSYHKELELGG